MTRGNLLLQPGIDRRPGVLASIMYPHLARTTLVALLALGPSIACADVYTWTDASGRLNVSNLAPPDGVRVDSIIREEAPKVTPAAAAAREAARNAQLQALNERVAQLQDEVDRAKQAPPVVYHAAPPSPPVQVTVNVMPSPPAESSAPDYVGYPNGPLPGFPYPGYPGLPYDYCEPTIFGCPAFGYPAGIVVLSAPHPHRFKHSGGMHGRSAFPGMHPIPVRSGAVRR